MFWRFAVTFLVFARKRAVWSLVNSVERLLPLSVPKKRRNISSCVPRAVSSVGRPSVLHQSEKLTWLRHKVFKANLT